MMGGRTPETCWAVNKRQDNKLKNCCIRLVIYLNWKVNSYFILESCVGDCDFSSMPRSSCGPGSIVGIASGYGLDGPGIESRWGDISHTCPDRLWGPPSLVYNMYRVFPGGKERPGRDADSSPLLVPWSWKSRAIPLLPLRAVRPVQTLSACAMGALYLLPYLETGILTSVSSWLLWHLSR
jgi:hypothetical protein